jgi:hypothetical protein
MCITPRLTTVARVAAAPLSPSGLLRIGIVLWAALLPGLIGVRGVHASGEGVRAARALFDKLYFAEAMKACQAGLETGGNTREDLLGLLRLKGLIAASLEDARGANEAFAALFAIEPVATLGEGHAPRILRAFLEAKQQAAKRGPLRISSSAPTSVPWTGSVAIRVRVEADPLRLVARASLSIRRAGAPSYRIKRVVGTSSFSWNESVSGLPGTAGRLEAHVALLDAHDNELWTLGTATSPRGILLSRPPATSAAAASALPAASGRPHTQGQGQEVQRPLVRRWWFWTAIGLAAVGTGLAIGLATRRPDRVNAPISVEVAP